MLLHVDRRLHDVQRLFGADFLQGAKVALVGRPAFD